MTGKFGKGKRPGILIGISVASVIAFSAVACAGDKPTSPTADQPTQGTVATQPSQGTVGARPTQGTVSTEPAPVEGAKPGQVMPVPPSDGTLPSPTGAPIPVEGIPQKGEGVAVGGFIGGPGAVVGSSYESYPSILPGIPVRSPSYGYNAQESQSPTGLWVTGIGEITVKPDLGILSVGVESRAARVAEARDKAAEAMQAIIDAARANGVAADDIATQYFSIYPEYRYVEVRNPDGSYGKQELVGYIVNNTAQVKIRNLDNVGKVIDATAIAGGDLVRINNIQFTVDDTSRFAAQMRELAAKDAMAKASVYAQALNVKVGGVMYLAELSSQAPIIQKDLAVAREAVAAGVSTPISPDTMKLSTSIQVAFTIGQ